MLLYKLTIYFSASGALQHSPSIHRKNKKPAPPPPPVFSPQQSREQLAKSEKPVKKPGVPPPGPPQHPTRPSESPPAMPPPSVPPTIPSPGIQNKSKSRPQNPPPPTPSATHSDTESIPTPASDSSTNPFLDGSEDVEAAEADHGRSSDNQDVRIKTHTRNASADIKSTPAEVKGHSRTKSHDLKMRQPPPIPQRTHSIPAKHSAEHKRLLQASDKQAAGSDGGKLIDIEEPSATTDFSKDIILEVEPITIREKEGKDKENRERANSSNNHTAL